MNTSTSTSTSTTSACAEHLAALNAAKGLIWAGKRAKRHSTARSSGEVDRMSVTITITCVCTMFADRVCFTHFNAIVLKDERLLSNLTSNVSNSCEGVRDACESLDSFSQVFTGCDTGCSFASLQNWITEIVGPAGCAGEK